MTQENIWLTIWSALLVLQFFPSATLGDIAAFAVFVSPLIAVGLLFYFYKETNK